MHGRDFVIGSRYKDGAKSYDDDFMTAIGNWMFTFMTKRRRAGSNRRAAEDAGVQDRVGNLETTLA